MAVSLKHGTLAVGTDAGNGEIRKTQWNEEHALTGTANALLAFDGSGDASELTPPAGDLVGTTATQTLSGKTLTGPIEPVHTPTGSSIALDPANGTLWLITLTANTTLTDSLSAGQSVTLLIDDGTAYTITWPTTTWLSGGAPTLATTGKTVVTLFKVGSTLYGFLVGDG